jgi:hypothetical protein
VLPRRYIAIKDGWIRMTENEKLLRVGIGAKGPYDHFFGHDPNVPGLTPAGGPEPAHLVLTLDTRDPLLARFGLAIGPRFRLVHPYVYDSEGETFAYRQIDGRIDFLPFASQMEEDWPYDDYPARFTQIPSTLEVEEPPPGDFSPDYGTDGNGLGGNLYSPYAYWYPHGTGNTIFLGKLQQTIQDSDCACPSCAQPAPLLARVPDQADGATEKTWDNTGVFTLFWYCAPCGLVISRNEV